MIRRVLAALSACALAVTVLASATQAQEAPKATAAAAAAEARLFELLNESRVAEGLVPLELRDGLSRLAREWSRSRPASSATTRTCSTTSIPPCRNGSDQWPRTSATGPTWRACTTHSCPRSSTAGGLSGIPSGSPGPTDDRAHGVPRRG